MKMSTIKKALAVTLAMTMVMASALTVCASDSGSGSGSGSSHKSSHSSSSSSSGGGSSTASVVSAGGSVSVGGVTIKTSVAGTYASTKVAAAVQAPVEQIVAALGLKDGQKPFIMVYDTDPEKSPAAMACVNAAAESIGATVVAAINVELGAKEAGKFITLSNGSIGMTVGIPNVDVTKTYSMVCVQPGGVVTILDDQDANPATVTFEVQAGLGTYAIVAK